jgi:hypothetical protein
MVRLLIVILFILVSGNVAAQDEVLNGRLITRMVSGTFVDVPNVEGRSVGSGQYAGVAVFEDGRLADKEFVLIVDNGGSEGSYSGYSTYTFENGDALILRFTGGWGPDRTGGDYEVISGKGAYEGATGTGSFDAVDVKWENTSLYDLTLKITHSS